MRVVFYNHNHEGYGTYWRCRAFGRELARRGHDVTLICASGKKLDLLVRERMEEGVRVMTLPRIQTPWSLHHNGQLLRCLLMAYRVITQAAEVHVAFAVAQPTTAMAAWCVQQFRKERLVVDWDDDWEKGMAWQDQALINWMVRTLERRVPCWAEAITVASPWLLQRAAEMGWSSKSELIPNGYEPRRSLPRVECSRHPLLVAVGNQFPGWRNWVEAFVEVRRQVPDLQVVLLGAKPQEARPDFIECRGFVSETEVEDWLDRASAAVLPMEDTVFDASRWPIRLGTYLRSGIPILSNAVGAVLHVLHDQPGHFVLPVQPSSDWIPMIVRAARSCYRLRPSHQIQALTWDRLTDRFEMILRGQKAEPWR